MKTAQTDVSHPHPRPRLDIAELAGGPYQALIAVDHALHQSPLDAKLRHLVKVRASQMNGCAFCVEMHVREARRLGESDDRLHQLAVWREALVFTPAERAALAYTEAATRLESDGVTDDVWQEASGALAPDALAALVVQVAHINALNRIAVPLRTPPGSFTKKHL